jgi:ABC-type enterochelin transport system permease subunit
MKDIVTDSLCYWEPRRVAFNAVLALVVAGSFFYHQPSLATLTWQPIIGLLLAAVLANVLYCAAYAADLLVQLSDYQAAWRRHRWLLWVAGTAFAAGIFLLHE